MNSFTFVLDWLILNLKRKHCWHIGLWEHWWTNNIQMWTATLILSISLYIEIIFNCVTSNFGRRYNPQHCIHSFYIFSIQRHNQSTLLFAFLNLWSSTLWPFSLSLSNHVMLSLCVDLSKRPLQCGPALSAYDWVIYRLQSWLIYVKFLRVHFIWNLGFQKLLGKIVFNHKMVLSQIKKNQPAIVLNFWGTDRKRRSEWNEAYFWIFEFLNLMKCAFSTLLQSFGDYIKCTF